jgi:hypothetical protein
MQKVTQLWNRLPDKVRRAIHTAWQVAVPVLLAHLFLARSSKDVQSAVIAAGAVALASLKAALVN